MRLAVNVVASQIAWFACVLGAAHGLPWLGPAAVAIVAWIHLSYENRRKSELLLLVEVGLLGAIVDAAAKAAGAVTFPHGYDYGPLAPLWMTALWVNLATMLRVSLAWLLDRLWLAALFGAVGGPLAYLAGDRLGALEMHPDRVYSIPVVGILWAVAMVVMCRLAAVGRKVPIAQ